MGFRITAPQRRLLADWTRTALVGWLITDPNCFEAAFRWQYRSTTVLGFSFPQFFEHALDGIGHEYRPGRGNPGFEFPLSIIETAVLANNVEAGLATEDQLYAAAVIVAYSPYCQPQVGSREWTAYRLTLEALGLSIHDPDSLFDWREVVRDRLSHSFPMAAE